MTRINTKVHGDFDGFIKFRRRICFDGFYSLSHGEISRDINIGSSCLITFT
jgi:hypothetical protein